MVLLACKFRIKVLAFADSAGLCWCVLPWQKCGRAGQVLPHEASFERQAANHQSSGRQGLIHLLAQSHSQHLNVEWDNLNHSMQQWKTNAAAENPEELTQANRELVNKVLSGKLSHNKPHGVCMII